MGPVCFLMKDVLCILTVYRVSHRKCVSQGGRVRFSDGPGGEGGCNQTGRGEPRRETAVGMKGRKLAETRQAAGVCCYGGRLNCKVLQETLVYV